MEDCHTDSTTVGVSTQNRASTSVIAFGRDHIRSEMGNIHEESEIDEEDEHDIEMDMKKVCPGMG